MMNHETTRLSLLKGEGRVRVGYGTIMQPLTSILSPSARGEADASALIEHAISRVSLSAMLVF
jgi:hypothetical protein